MTSNPRRDYETIVVDYLFERQFVVEPTSTPGEYVVTANGDGELPLRPTLSLDNHLLSEYLTAMSEDYPNVSDPLLEALSLTEIHIEEELDTVDLEGHNHAKALGVRRGPQGKAEWFAERAEPNLSTSPVQPSAHLGWQADPPGRPARDVDVEGWEPDLG